MESFACCILSNYWKKVSRCVIDGGSGVFQGKVVVDFNHLEKSDHNVVVLE